MKTLSLFQPWAMLVVAGAKRFETRSWRTPHRGLLGIHAARRFPAELRLLCSQQPIRTLLAEAGARDWHDLPLGALVGTVELVDCTRTEELGEIVAADRALGNFEPGRWAWLLRDARRFPGPIPAVGKLRLFEVECGLSGVVANWETNSGGMAT
jgi:hypothetical protein